MAHSFLSSSAELLDREVSKSYRRECSDLVAAERVRPETNFKSVVIFSICSEWLALPTNVVKEIAEHTPVHRLPHRNRGVVQGIVNVRGEVLVCVGLDVLLGLQDSKVQTKPSGRERLVVCDNGNGPLAFIAAAVHGVHRYLPRELREVPATLARATETFTAGILPWRNHQTIGCLDSELVFHGLNKAMA